MRDFLKKTEFTFALKVGLLLSLVIAASIIKQQEGLKNNKKSMVQNMSIELPTTVFANF